MNKSPSSFFTLRNMQITDRFSVFLQQKYSLHTLTKKTWLTKTELAGGYLKLINLHLEGKYISQNKITYTFYLL